MSEASNIVDQAIRSRKTVKVLSDKAIEVNMDRSVVDALLIAAGWAPFHRPAAKHHQEIGNLDSKVPWRFYLLDGLSCRALREELIREGDETKIPKMLAAAATLVQVTWLPNKKTSDDTALFDPTLENMEHIAAASAAIQNLLIAATAKDIQTYWSSGGGLRKPENMARLGIPKGEILLGSIFLFSEVTDACIVNPGKLREERGAVNSWARWVKLDG